MIAACIPDFVHVRWRFVFAVLGAMGMAIIYGLKVNLSVAIVSMIDHDHLEDEHDYKK